MRLAIADPPYLGRSNRWYGDGAVARAVDTWPIITPRLAPGIWPRLTATSCAVCSMSTTAIAAAPDSLPVYLGACVGVVPRVMIWHRRNAPPSGSRVGSMWEPVIIRIPDGRSANGTGLHVSDVLDEAAPRRNFAGSKPDAWTRWVLDALGYRPDEDELHDIFAGSGAVAAAADGMLALVGAADVEIRTLLDIAENSAASQTERNLAYRRAQKLIESLNSIHVPQSLMAQLEESHRLMLTVAPTPGVTR